MRGFFDFLKSAYMLFIFVVLGVVGAIGPALVGYYGPYLLVLFLEKVCGLPFYKWQEYALRFIGVVIALYLQYRYMWSEKK